MNRLKIILLGIVFAIIVPLSIYAATIWTGTEVYHPDKTGVLWEVKEDSITKVENPGAVYGINDLKSYSAYVTNNSIYIGDKIEHSLYWFNKSRLSYVKLIKVTPGQDVSFLFSAEKYVCCAEYDSSFTLLRDGDWLTTGDTLTVTNQTSWLFLIFRNATGDLAAGGGTEHEIRASDIQDLEHKYLILKPFTYTFNLNGGNYNGSSGTFTKERLGVTKMTLPIPIKSGYTFAGWRSQDNRVYNGEIPVEYNNALFCDATLEAMWNKIPPNGIILNKSDIVLEENSDEFAKLTAQIFPAETPDKNITWTSDNTNVATVSNDGVVYPNKSGVAKITATTANGLSASCMVYVMGFKISIPDYCNLDESYEIKVDVYNNGMSNSEGRKHILLKTDDTVELVRVGDVDTKCQVLAETSVSYGGTYSRVGEGYVIDTMESMSLFYRLKTDESYKKTGDYEGKVTFTVSVQ